VTIEVDVPPGWTETSLGELFKFSNGVNADKSRYGQGIPFINVLEVITYEGLTKDQIPGRIELAPAVAAHYCVRHGDILFNRTSETPEDRGLASVYLSRSPIVFGGFVFRGRARTECLSTAYSKYAFRAPYVRAQIVSRSQGAIRANVSQRDLKKVRVVLPPHDEQIKVAETLATSDNLIDLLSRLIDKKEQIKQGMMQQLLTGATRLPEFSGRWKEVKLGDVSTMSSGGTPSSDVSDYYGGGIPWVSITDITRSGKYVRSTEKSLSRAGLLSSAAKLYSGNVVLYAIYASLGECALPVHPMSSSQAILGILPGRLLDREFLYYHLTSRKDRVKELGQHGTQANLNAGMVRAFRLNLPPVEEQRAIAVILRDADVALDTLRKRLAKAAAAKQGIVQQLLTGRTRLCRCESAAV